MRRKKGLKEKLNAHFYCVLGNALNSHELMEFFDTYQLSSQSARYAKETRGNRKVIARKVFCRALKYIINDIIDNRVRFKVPTYKGESYLQMKAYKDEELRDMVSRKMFDKVDFLKSFFTGYRLQYLAKNHAGPDVDQMIYVSANERDKIIENTNKGFIY